MDLHRRIIIRHWLPHVTFCPVNNLPDLVYVSIHFDGPELRELYGYRKRIRKIVREKRLTYMEDLAERLALEFPDATEVTVRLAFNRHEVSVYPLKDICYDL